jgi:hypothetical protein
MPNSIKYSTTAQTLALKSGNYWIGTGDVGKGPTSTTDYWNGINPPGGGYTVYLNKSSQGPSIHICNSDSDLINLTNIISGENYTTAAQCLTYYVDQVDKMAMNKTYPSIVTNGLAFLVDGGFTPSYPATGTSWYDLSGNNRNSTFVNGASWNSGGWVEFDGVDDRSTTSFGFLGNNESHEALIYSKGNVSTYNMFMGIILPYYGFWQGNQYIVQDLIGGAQVGYIAGSLSLNRWYHFLTTRSYNGTNTTLTTYINGTLSAQQTFSGAPGVIGGTWAIGNWDAPSAGSSYPFYGNVSDVKIYNRTLSSTEVSQNYYGASIVTDGLVFAIDAGNLVSYPTTGTGIYSLAGSFTASLVNGVGYSPNFGGIFDFDGSDDFIELPFDSYWNSNVFGTATNFTLECWYKPDLFKNWDTVIEKSESSGWYSRSEGPAIWTDVGSLQGVFASGVDGNPSGSVLVLSYATTTLKWYHICFTGDGTTLRLYVDGIERTSAAVSSRTVAVYNGNVGPRLGRRAFMDGQLGPTRFYTRGLSGQEVTQNFNAQRPRFGI